MALREASKYWNLIKQQNFLYDEVLFENCHKVALNIETGEASHCFSLNQFIYVFPFLRSMKFKKSGNSKFRLRSPGKFCKRIYYGRMVCSSNFSSSQVRRHKRPKTNNIPKRNRMKILSIECEVEYLVTLDFEHSLCLIRSQGKHSENCHLFQQRQGCNIMKRLMNFLPDRSACLSFMHASCRESLLVHYGRDSINLHNKKFKAVRHLH